MTAGVLRIVDIVGGPQLLPANPRVNASPAPVVIHVAAAAAYALVGAFQFSARLRRRHPGWHRKAGRVLVGAGLIVAVSGLYLTLLYPRAPGGALLWTVRLVVGSAMGASLVAGFSAIRRRDIAAHRAWMIRAYALGVGAGTQVFPEGFGAAALGTGDMSKVVSLSAGWIINAAVAEWAIRRIRPHPRSARTQLVAHHERRLRAARRAAMSTRREPQLGQLDLQTTVTPSHKPPVDPGATVRDPGPCGAQP